ncbi:TetR/AcrR family transcriptional regulator [Nitriliruptor alkaliphilus]|uniref:TetR/AcrR family transcriptional regulator n=1 Tax=Nitriliruptor alkaliphilus TaxID=427918 RepID=UPI0009F87B97|nr:TetR family transcriptional regulator [Nitriliruptor alkaliphilus]
MSTDPPPSGTDDRTGRARIRDAAIELFGERGVDGTSLKLIAEAAGVSQPLIVHHFGSKDGLRVACDEHVAAQVRASKLDAMSQGPSMDPMAALRGAEDSRHLMRYLGRTLTDGSPHVAVLVDEMVDDAVEYMAEGERTGLILPSEHPRSRAAVLTLWSLGLLTLFEHAERLLGVDLLGSPEQYGAYVLPALEMLSKGVVPEALYDQMRDALANEQDAPS